MKIIARLPPPPHLLLCLMRVVYGVCIVPGSPLPGSSYWLLMMWGYDVIKILGSIGTIQYPPPRLAGDLSHYTTQHNTHQRYIHT